VVSRSDVDDTPAKTTRVNKHDIVLKVNGAILGTVEELIDVVVDAGDDDQPVGFTLSRGGDEHTLSVTPEERPKRVEKVITRNPSGVLADNKVSPTTSKSGRSKRLTTPRKMEDRSERKAREPRKARAALKSAISE